MTTEEFLDLPPEPDGVVRELIRGVLRERDMTTRRPKHSAAEACISTEIVLWLRENPRIRAVVVAGEVRCRLALTPPTVVGIDVAVFIGDEHLAAIETGRCFEGPPAVAIEILSPSDTQAEVHEKVGLYLSHGVLQVWVVDPDFRTVTVFRSGDRPVLFAEDQVIPGGVELPGFETLVAKLFPPRPGARPA
jgi:Uma2 family endonuclease